MTDFATLKAHLERTGRLKLLPKILRELRVRVAQEKVVAGKKETAKENPSLIAGWRQIENGILTDHSAKGALVDIYKNVIQ